MKPNTLIAHLGAWIAATTAYPAQTTADSSGASSQSAEEAAPVKLTVFEVTADKDVAYQGGNTTSGSRLNTSLQDTAATIMVFTPEFISDFGLNTLAEITNYAQNFEVDNQQTRDRIN